MPELHEDLKNEGIDSGGMKSHLLIDFSGNIMYQAED